jgi:hypothetical protein
MAFTIDPNSRDIGVVKQNLYYTQPPKTNKEYFVWANFAQPETGTKSDSLKNSYRDYTHAFFETARYMLLNNKKTNGK